MAQGQRVLVHCAMGHNRSALLAGVILTYLGMSGADAVTRAIVSIEGIEGIHHLHIWALGPSRPALSCHLMVGDVPVKSTGNLLSRVKTILERDFGIAHTTVQFEFSSCDVDDPYCVPYSDVGRTG